MSNVAAFVPALAAALQASLWQGLVLALAAWFALALLERRGAAIRHLVGMIFLLLIALAPILTFLHALREPAASGSAMPPDMASLAPPALLAWFWGAGVAWKLSRLAAGWRAFRRLEKRSFEMLPNAWRARAERLRQRLRIRRAVDIRLVTGVLPCSARFLRPVIWLPATLLARMSVEQIEAILAHELAHIRRLDWLWNGLQCAVDALFFYHPGVWWLSRRVRQERETACDDLAVQACGDPIVLAEALGTLETLRATSNFVLSIQGGHLMNRISRLLVPGAKPPRRRAFVFAALALAGGAALALHYGAAATGADAAPRWWQLHGDAIQLSATIGNEHRNYERWRDSDNAYRERYLVDGHARPIDAAARQWIAVASIPPAPPLPPPPPVFASMRDDPAYRAAVAAIHRDPAIRATLGALEDVQISGPSRITQDTAELTLSAIGARGTLRVRAVGHAQDGNWRFETERAGR
jgi:beta-lactamase regulating signal transducer with metallopeptidase domain